MFVAKRLLVIVLCLFIAVAPALGCVNHGFYPGQKEELLAEVDAQEREGLLTEAQAESIREVIRSDGEIDWGQVMMVLGGFGGAVLTALTGVRITRGPGKPMDPSQAQVLKQLADDFLRRKKAEAAAAADETSPVEPAA